MAEEQTFHPCIHAAKHPDKPAIIMAATGETLTFGELETRSNQGAQFFRSIGLKKGDTVAFFMTNSIQYLELAWAAQRSGLYFTCISSRLTAPEIDYIVQDSGARVLFSCPDLAEAAKEVKAITKMERYFSVCGEVEGYEAYESLRDDMPSTRVADESAGADMLYSSGTTGRPKGIRPPLDPDKPIGADSVLRMILSAAGGITEDSIYLSPAPLYHAAPLRWTMTAMSIGATAIIMDKFDPETFLKLVEKYRVTHTQLVPTMFVKMLKLPEAARKQYDLSSLKFAVHAAAPCPVPVKEQMIEWWGPVIHEYYAGSEGNGLTWISSPDWMTHKGSVGKPLHGVPHICDEEGNELGPNEEGMIYFSDTTPPTYHNDPEKSKKACHPFKEGWSSLGDIGKLDEDGFLYLTDRKAFMIISGGVNIYPQEAENVLITHPKVADVAVIGVPNDEFGEEVKAVVQPMPGIAASDELGDELIRYCQSQLSKIKCPKSVDFDPELPRHPTGKLYKRLVRDRYWGKSDSRII
ncbi:acyl-CoA synthetase [Ponticaulis sp.]|uniref:acyl-CoA synthetase n=1 Tax=Ponticaulis sp. TaxID=2020902 RepID=UPI00261595F0|nr:acyl-CoA synthetase [Ponticaulis sp.]MDF1681130.1 acyl-CoA synthetase [Ponticaulis sp.]